MTKELQVQNLTCADCAQKIKDALAHLSGVSRVEVNEEYSSVKFVAEHREDVVWVKDQLMKLGYPPVGMHSLKKEMTDTSLAEL
jgi:copper chaperone CopZ